jgi:tRNA pseudouridine38-40 synthase
MPNIKLTIEYDGTNYAGWQRQTSHPSPVISHRFKTIQETLEDALRKIFQKKISLIGSGRTDAGVHAVAQTANFKTDKPMLLERLKAALNGLLPKDIAVKKVEEVPPGFHARFSAKSKTYVYYILQTSGKTAFASSCIWSVGYHLNVRLMALEAKSLLGKHDFRSFQAQDRCKRSSVATVRRLDIKKHKGHKSLPFFNGLDIITIEIEADGFSRNMVRNIVGTLVDMGRGKGGKGSLMKILQKRDRRCAGVCAPAKGLYLSEVKYE